MIRYLIDTNIVSHAARYPQGRVADRWLQDPRDVAAINVIVAGEARFGIIKDGSRPLLAQMDLLLSGLTVLPLGAEVVATYAEVRHDLERRGRLIGANDLWIAAHALSINATVVTDNVDEFRRVTGLRVENWLRD